jgi:hypothetical protein
MSKENQGRYYRVMFYFGQSNRRDRDLPLVLPHVRLERPPHSRKLQRRADRVRIRYGMVRSDHTLKPAAEELVSFARVERKMDFSKRRLVEPDATVLLPESYYGFLG